MYLTEYHIHRLRNIVEGVYKPVPGVNLINGGNGSGKTSHLEALCFLGLGKSFRTRYPRRIIQSGGDDFALYAEVRSFESGGLVRLGVVRDQHNGGRIRVNGEDVRTAAALAAHLPLQVVHPDSRKILTDGPRFRRQLMDWGIFHSSSQYFEVWRDYQRTLKHRNAVLKGAGQAVSSEMLVWNEALCCLGRDIDRHRRAYVDGLCAVLKILLLSWLPGIQVGIKYMRGWSDDLTLAAVLDQQIARDLVVGHTHSGAHRADLRFLVGGTPVSDVLSQGQQKVFVYALKLAQAQLLQVSSGKRCVFLLDDLPAELDFDKQSILMDALLAGQHQLFVTGIETGHLAEMVGHKGMVSTVTMAGCPAPLAFS